MRKWVGARVINNLIARAFELKNEDWEYTFAVDYNDIFYDNLGAYEDRGRIAGDVGARWYEKIVTDAMVAGNVTNCWDGQTFYNANHPVNFDDSGAGVYSNSLTALPLTPDNLWVVCAAMMSIKNENGLPMEIVPTVLEVPPSLGLKGAAAIAGAISLATTTATGLINQTSGVVAAAGVSNMLPTALQSITGILKLVINPRLSGQVYYVHSSNLLKPFIMQVAKDPTDLLQITDPQNPEVFHNKRLMYGCDAKGVAAGTLPFLSFRVSEI
jgi:phage major head subunit gpT-like protein